jgi:anti-sigma factor RsiW
MRCAECLELLNPYHDGELLPEEAAEVRDHLAQCPECTRAYNELVATSHLLQEGLVHYAAPDVLKARIRSALTQEDARAVRPVLPSSRWLRLAAAGLLIAVTSSVATWGTVRARSTSLTARDEILASHVRSLMPGHLTDVASNNQHNVKPWFNGRIDLSPPVPGLDSAGFVLDGGRLDYVGGRTVAAVVYQRRQHVVNVFSWPEAGDNSDPSVGTTQGYHLVNWRTGGVAFWAASDLNETELSEFVALFRHGGAEAKR